MSIRVFDGVRPTIGNGVFIDDTALVLGRVTIGDDSSVWPMVVARGDVHDIHIGARTNIQDATVLHVTSPNRQVPNGFPLVIGNEVTVGHRAILHACTIGNRCLIGMGAVVMDGAVVEDDVIVGAGALVPPSKVLESGHLYVGSPARKTRALTPEELRFLQVSAQHYVSLKNKHLTGV